MHDFECRLMLLKLFFLLHALSYYIISAKDVGDMCKSNDNESNGMCLLITDCSVALKEIQQKNFHKFKRCGFKGLIEIVCCPQLTTDKFGDIEKKTERVAVRECQKIVENSIPPLGLYIIGGEEASLGEFPHMVALGYESQEGYDFLCGGTLLSDSYVLTAAHCVATIDQIRPKIARMGVVDLEDNKRNNETDVDILEIITHPKYTKRHKYHDLALLRLAKPIQFTINLNPVCLYTNLDDPKIPLTVTGWGKTSNTRSIRSNILLKANVSVVAREECAKSYTSWRKLPDGISDAQLCAGDPQGLKDTCQGDSGGPLQGLTHEDGHYRLVGVTSFGRGCGSSVPGVYTRVAKYLDWIESVVWPN